MERSEPEVVLASEVEEKKVAAEEVNGIQLPVAAVEACNMPR